MKIKLLIIGKTNEKYLAEGISVYASRLSHYLPFEIEIIPETKGKQDISVQKEKEGEQILKRIKQGEHLVLLDEKGKMMTSVQFSNYIGQKMNTGNKALVFVIGGAFGFSEKVYRAANDAISLSSMTFSHQMVRLIFTEQLYRAMTILKNEPYHHV